MIRFIFGGRILRLLEGMVGKECCYNGACGALGWSLGVVGVGL